MCGFVDVEIRISKALRLSLASVALTSRRFGWVPNTLFAGTVAGVACGTSLLSRFLWLCGGCLRAGGGVQL